MIDQEKSPSFWVCWGPALAIMVAIFLISSTPSSGIPDFGPMDPLLKKSGHLLGYALLAASYLYGLRNRSLPAFGLAWLMAVVYAATDEYHQSFVMGRGSTIVDVGIDAFGALLGLLVIALSRFQTAESHHSPNSNSNSSF